MLVEGILVEVKKKAIKNIHIHIKAPLGNVLVTAPKRTSDATIARIIQDKATWIRKQQEQMKVRMDSRPVVDIDEAEQRKLLKMRITELLPKWEALTGLHCQTWQLRKMKTRWGSCNIKTKKIWFNLHLAQTTNRCLEYIILHELLHIRIANHGSEFKENMDRYMPNWREVRKELNQYILF